MSIYKVQLDISCELQIEAENAKRAHKIIEEYFNLRPSQTKDKKEYIEVIDWNIDDVEIEVDDEEWLICDNCNGGGCRNCKFLGDVKA